MSSYRDWKERLVAARGVLPNRLRYTRSATDFCERGTDPHRRQNEMADQEWGAIDPTWLWQENYSGSTFDRPGFQDMLAFCRANPRPKQSPGRVEMYDRSRVARMDVRSIQSLCAEFDRLGWPVHFVTDNRAGDRLADLLSRYGWNHR